MESENTGTQVPLGCTCGQPRTVGVMHRSEGPCQAVYATVPLAQAKPDLSGLVRHVCNLRDQRGMERDAIGAWVRYADVAALLAHPVAQAKPDTRDAVLEEAAKACETQFVGLGGPPDDPHPDAVLVNGAVYDCAKAIRALKVKPEGDVS